MERLLPRPNGAPRLDLPIASEFVNLDLPKDFGPPKLVFRLADGRLFSLPVTDETLIALADSLTDYGLIRR